MNIKNTLSMTLAMLVLASAAMAGIAAAGTYDDLAAGDMPVTEQVGITEDTESVVVEAENITADTATVTVYALNETTGVYEEQVNSGTLDTTSVVSDNIRFDDTQLDFANNSEYRVEITSTDGIEYLDVGTREYVASTGTVDTLDDSKTMSIVALLGAVVVGAYVLRMDWF